MPTLINVTVGLGRLCVAQACVVCLVSAALVASGVRAQAAVAEPVSDNRGVYFRATLESGYGRYVYVTSDRYGDGAVFATTLTLGAGVGTRLMLGATAAFHAMPRARGQGGSGAEWGPYFGPSGYLGPTLGVLGDRVSFDLTLA